MMVKRIHAPAESCAYVIPSLTNYVTDLSSSVQ